MAVQLVNRTETSADFRVLREGTGQVSCVMYRVSDGAYITQWAWSAGSEWIYPVGSYINFGTTDGGVTLTRNTNYRIYYNPGTGSWNNFYFKTLPDYITNTKTISGAVSIVYSNSSSITGKIRVSKTSLTSVLGAIRIRKYYTAALSGVVDILKTKLKSIDGKVRIEGPTYTDISGIVCINNPNDRVSTQTIAGKARIQKAVNKAITGRTRIAKNANKTIAGVTRIQKNQTATISGLSRIAKNISTTITGKVKIRVATPEKLPVDWNYNDGAGPEDWSKTDKDATSWGRVEKPTDSWSENDKDATSWTDAGSAGATEWEYPLEDTG